MVLQMSYFPDCFHFGLCDASTFKPSMPCPIPLHASLVCVLNTSFLLFFSSFFGGRVQSGMLTVLPELPISSRIGKEVEVVYK